MVTREVCFLITLIMFWADKSCLQSLSPLFQRKIYSLSCLFWVLKVKFLRDVLNLVLVNFTVLSILMLLWGDISNVSPAPNVSGFIAQLVRALHRYGEVTGSNPLEVLTFSSLKCVHNCEDYRLLDLGLFLIKLAGLSLSFHTRTVWAALKARK